MRTGSRLLVECWCQAKLIEVPVADIRRLRTGSCGRSWCRPTANLAPPSPPAAAPPDRPRRLSCTHMLTPVAGRLHRCVTCNARVLQP